MSGEEGEEALNGEREREDATSNSDVYTCRVYRCGHTALG